MGWLGLVVFVAIAASLLWRESDPSRRMTVYIAAPFAPACGLDAAENTRRAVLLAMIYRRRGYHVECVHPDILAGRYGDDNDPTQRAAGMERTLALVRKAGRLAVLLRPDGTMSAGTAEERRQFELWSGGPVDVWRWGASGPEEVEPWS